MNIPLEIIVGIITLCGVLTTAIINMLNNKHKNSSDQTIETMRVQKELIGTLFDENQVLSKRMNEIEGEINFNHQDLQRGLLSQNTLERSMNVSFCNLFRMRAFRYE